MMTFSLPNGYFRGTGSFRITGDEGIISIWRSSSDKARPNTNSSELRLPVCFSRVYRESGRFPCGGILRRSAVNKGKRAERTNA